MNRYEVGKEYFLKAMVAEKDLDGQYPLRVVVPVDTPLKSEYTSIRMANAPGILLTAEEVAAIHNRDIVNLERAVEELREENKTLRKKIDKHETTIEERTIECNRWEGMYDKVSRKCDELRKKNDELTAWYEEANRTASEAAEANDELKAKIAELRTRNAELEALLKEVTATRDEAIKQNNELIAENERLKADRDEWKKVAANNASFHRDACNERDELKTANDDLKAMVGDLKDRLERSKVTIEKQSDKLRELQTRIVELNEVNSSLGENRDALNNEAAVHMTSIHNLQVAVEVLAEKIFEMRCEQDG